MSNILAYLNGHWLPQADLALPIDDLGFLMGVTITERLRTFNHEPFRVNQHLARLRHSLDLMGWNAERLSAQAEEATYEFVTRNRPLMQAGDDWNIVVFVTPGKRPDASAPTLCVHGNPIPFASWSDQFDAGLPAVIVPTRQVPPNCWDPALKCRSRMHYYLADRQAEDLAPGSRAILLDQDGFVGEGSSANVIAYYREQGLVTPHLEKVLPGVSQQVVFELAGEMGLGHIDRDLTPADLAEAEEIWFTSTSICLLPVATLDGASVGNGPNWPVYTELLRRWSEKVGVDIAAQARAHATRR